MIRALGRPRGKRRRSAEEVALNEADIELGQGLGLGLRLDTLGDEPALRGPGEVPHPGHERLLRGIAVDAPDQGDVELHERRIELKDVPQAGEASAGIVDGEAHGAAKPRDAPPERCVVPDDGMLRDLEDEPVRHVTKKLPEVGPSHDELGRDVEVEEPAPGDALARRVDRGFERRQLELASEADRGCIAEAAIRGCAIGEPGERLVPDRQAGPHVDDRLEHRREGTLLDDAFDLGVHPSRDASVGELPPEQRAGEIGKVDKGPELLRQPRHTIGP